MTKLFALIFYILFAFNTLSYASSDPAHEDQKYTEYAHSSHDHDHHSHEHENHNHDDFEFTEHKAHVHGLANASISFSNHQLAIKIILPAIDVFGFEHKATTPNEHAIIDEKIKILSSIENTLKITPRCDIERYHVHQHNVDHSHSDVEIETLLNCDDNQPKQIRFDILETIPTLDNISIEYISDNKQAIYTANINNKAITAD